MSERRTLRAWLVQLVLPVALAAGLLALVLWLGWEARRWLDGPSDDPPPKAGLRALDCNAPPGLTRLEFLDEVLSLSSLADDESDESKVKDALLKHPWVRAVPKLELGVKPTATLYFRVPVLRVLPWDRAVDRDGVVLPRVPAEAVLFRMRSSLKSPTGKPGQPSGDKDVSEAAAVAGLLLIHVDELKLAGAEIKVKDGRVTVGDVVWGKGPVSAAEAAARLERLRKGERDLSKR